VQRKVFRVEKMFAGRRAAAPAVDAEQRHALDEIKALRAPATRRDGLPDASVQSLQRELARIHEAIAHDKRELAALVGDRNERRMARAAGELGAAVEGMEKATEKILKSTETIDDGAKALAATLKTDYERGLAQDIQDHVVKIYEACNFQDLAGQRIGNVIRTLNMLEDQVAGMLERCSTLARPGDSAAAARSSCERGLLNGPRLDGDCGHASQRDVDAMFG
jgi:chemotaxis protein CheZ